MLSEGSECTNQKEKDHQTGGFKTARNGITVLGLVLSSDKVVVGRIYVRQCIVFLQFGGDARSDVIGV